ncbi:MAG: hypothetical protein KG028_10975 [Actinobacteria bacterium]|jgi:hypothetical protein|nr:hypothetical protein [Actinomycetota bacterium]
MIRRTVAALLVGTLAAAFAMLGATADTGPQPGGFDPTRLVGHVPQPMLGAYLDAAQSFDIDWALLAAIGQLECDHFRNRMAGCWPPGTVNHAGARGPMQFVGSTWRTDAEPHDLEVAGPPPSAGGGWGTDGDGDGIADPWSVYDAVHAAARYLVELGGRDDPRTAAKHYNAGPANPDPIAGEGYATRVVELMAELHALAGHGGPGATTLDPPAGGAAGCTLADPTGTGGCVTPTTAALVAGIRAAFPNAPISCWAPRPANPTSDHPHGRACDITYGVIGRFPTPSERAAGWAFADWLVANAQQLDIAYVIWDGRIWTSTGWRTYTGGGVYNPNHPTGGHYDHIHVSVRR